MIETQRFALWLKPALGVHIPDLRGLSAVALSLVLALPASADPATCRKKFEAYLQQSKSLSAFIAEDANCLEATDNCSLCARQPDGSITCSPPSISCVQAENRCTRTSSLNYSTLKTIPSN
ncbi:hypothetical protein [uncultured Cohaesibacter sp.]|uniref:hypothetical protein n=1 Tax=uncultured Cohaesibacter sp. TaxID=1002546 RepID=UPI0029C868EE|nr:hypothetical protein [uncultured Cohaesibacter sp.]